MIEIFPFGELNMLTLLVSVMITAALGTAVLIYSVMAYVETVKI